MHWNYRIFKKKNQETGKYYYGLYETYYDEKGGMMWSERAEFGHGERNEQGELHECPCFESVDDLFWTLNEMLDDANKCKDDILDHDAEPTFPFPLESNCGEAMTYEEFLKKLNEEDKSS